MAKPLVATTLAVEGLRLIRDEHYLLAETAGEFVAQIRRLEADPGLRRRLGAAGRAWWNASTTGRSSAGQLDAAYADVARGVA